MGEMVEFRTEQGNRLVGNLYHANGSDVAVALGHGLFSDSEKAFYTENIARKLYEKGISALRFDMTGHGESNERNHVDFQFVTPATAGMDMSAAAKFLKSKGYVRIGLMGSSYSGYGALFAAAEHDVGAVVLISAPWDYREPTFNMAKLLGMMRRIPDIFEHWKSEGFLEYKGIKIGYNFWEVASSNNSKAYDAAKKINAPVLILHGSNDEQASIEQPRLGMTCLNNGKLIVFESTGHGLNGREDEVLHHTTQFFVDNLLGEEEPLEKKVLQDKDQHVNTA
jgi:uncharacterized protein